MNNLIINVVNIVSGKVNIKRRLIMAEENHENEKSREKYYYLDKKKTCKFLSTILASFLGTLLALAVFTALHKPPMPPAGYHMKNRPCPCKFMERRNHHDKMLPRKEFNEDKIYRENRDVRKSHEHNINKELRDKQFPQGKIMPPQTNGRGNAPIPPAPKTDNVKK